MASFTYSLILALAICSFQILTGCQGSPAEIQVKGRSRLLRAEESEGILYLENLDPAYSSACNAEMTARWNYITNVTDENADKATEALNTFLAFQAEKQAEIRELFGEEWKEWSDPTKREFKFLAIKGPGTMPPSDVDKMNSLKSKMETVYSTAKVCEYNNPSNCELRLEPEITEKMATATDFDELAYYWTAWHDAMSAGVPSSDYKQFAAYQTQMAEANDYPDMGTLWMQNYDTGDSSWTSDGFKSEMLGIWEELKPFYSKLHAYVRMKLRKDPVLAGKIKKYGYIPANLMGNMWSQDWTKLDATTKPFPEAPSLDATEAMIKKGWTATDLFHISDDFFASMGLDRMTDTFWQKSMLVRPEDGRDVVCHASAEDFCIGPGNTDFRIKQCTELTHNQLVTVHHEMGHIEYFQLYTNHHFAFRTSANDGFHEAIGDALALAVTTPKHLQCYLELDMGLDINCSDTKARSNRARADDVTPTDYNSLYITALTKLVFFPFAISMDAWRWEVFDGSLVEAKYNDRWWELRSQNQGIVPPLGPRDSSKFDPAAKYHIVANVEYLRYFVSHIVQFQFYEAMCIAAGEFEPENPDTKPLYQCDFSGSLEAGAKLRAMMELGFSRPWPEALEALTGTLNMTVAPLLNYLKPLFDLMDAELLAAGEVACFGADCQAEAKRYLEEHYEGAASDMANKLAIADWNYQTNVTDENAAAAEAANIAWSEFVYKEWRDTISQFDWEAFDDSDFTKRQFKFLSYVGTAALSTEDLEEYNKILSEMQTIYSTGKICPFDKQDCDLESEGWALNPELEDKLQTSKDYDELSYVWTGWRNVSGAKLRGLYNTYLDLNQKAADAEGFANIGDFWILRYESDTFRDDMRTLWDGVKPLYDELHAYVRHKLSVKWPGKIQDGEPIPAHVLGNMWAQSWEWVYDDVIPFPGDAIFDITPYLVENYQHDLAGVTALFDVANEFFTSSGLSDMGMSYKDPPGLGMILKPTDREAVCHASAWDFSDGEDFRIKMCTNINMQDFITIHHELGHIQYDINYKGLPLTLREGANPGFHEAIGDVLSLSVATPKHMQTIGFMNESTPTNGSTINYLMKMALEKVAFLPFGFMIDSYRWKLFDGSIPRDRMNYYWMQMRSEFQGIVPPTMRDDVMDFDAGSKYHVPANVPYIRYFVSFILQFQIHKVLCTEAGEYPGNGMLHECDIYKNPAAGATFKKILESGASKNWQDLLEEITGDRKLDPSAILEYFTPLMNYLKSQRAELNYGIGWRERAFEEFYNGPPISTTTTTSTPAPPTAPTTPTTPTPAPPTAPTTPTTSSTIADTDAPPVTSDDPSTTDKGGTTSTAASVAIVVMVTVAHIVLL